MFFPIQVERKNTLHGPQNFFNRDPRKPRPPFFPSPYLHFVDGDVIYRNVLPILFEMLRDVRLRNANPRESGLREGRFKAGFGGCAWRLAICSLFTLEGGRERGPTLDSLAGGE